MRALLPGVYQYPKIGYAIKRTTWSKAESMFPHYFYRHPTHFYFSLIALIGFLIYCWCTDSVGGGTESFYVVMCRATAKNLKLVLLLVGGIIAAFVLVTIALGAAAESATPVRPGYGGVEGEKFHRFMNRVTWPAQAAIDGFLGLLGVIAFCIALGVQWLSRLYFQNLWICNVALLLLYLLWLWYTVRSIVEDETPNFDKSRITVWSIVAFGTWIAVVVSVGELWRLFSV